MSIDFEYIDRLLIVRINGDIDHHSCEEIRSKIDKAIKSKILSPFFLIWDG